MGAEKKGAAVMLRSINNHAPLVNRGWGGRDGGGRAMPMPMATAMWPPPGPDRHVVWCGRACGVVWPHARGVRLLQSPKRRWLDR